MTVSPALGRPGIPPRSSRPTKPRRPRSWPVPLSMILLSLIPLIAGAARLVELAGGPAAIPHDQRFTTSPWPVIAHIVGAAVYAIAGAFQFVPRFRARHLDWHRRTGRILAAAGAVVVGSALWMTLTFATKPGTGEVLYVERLAFGSAMAACLVLGITTVRRGDIAAHRVWMIRSYAIALAAGTQAFTVGIGQAVFGTSVLVGDLSLGAGWVVNLAVAEWVIRRPARVRAS